MAVSHQWFVQWSAPSALLADISEKSNTFSHPYTWNGFLPYNSDVHLSDARNYDYYERPKLSTSDANVNNYANSYSTTLEKHPKDNYNAARNRLVGAALWLTLMGVTRPPGAADTTTPPFTTLYKWKQIDFEFPSPVHRRRAIATGKYIAENVLPLGLEVWGSRIWVTLPSWRPGVPATLATAPRYPAPGHVSPPLTPYPDWQHHRAFGDGKNCSGLVSVFRVSADPCGRLWVLDSGQIDSVNQAKQICPPSVIAFDLNTDEIIARYPIPKKYVLQNSLYSTIIVDTRKEDCSDLHLYIADPWRFGLLVFRESDAEFWRFTHHLFYPDPLASNYSLHGLKFQWSDGIFGLSLSPITDYEDRVLFFNSMSSFHHFYVMTSVLRQPSRVSDSVEEFNLIGDSRGEKGQVSTTTIDRRGVMFYGLVTRDTVGCWDTSKPYTEMNRGVVATNPETLVFPNDVKVDSESPQNLWVISNRLPFFQDGPLDSYDYNYRVMFVDTREAVRGTICDPAVQNLWNY